MIERFGGAEKLVDLDKFRALVRLKPFWHILPADLMEKVKAEARASSPTKRRPSRGNKQNWQGLKSDSGESGASIVMRLAKDLFASFDADRELITTTLASSDHLVCREWHNRRE